MERLLAIKQGTDGKELVYLQATAEGKLLTDPGSSGGGSSGGPSGGESVIDAANVVWWMVANTTTNTVIFYQYGTTTVGTPTMPVKPYEYTVGNVAVTELPAAAATNLANIDTDIGALADAPWAGTGAGSVIATLKGIFNKLGSTLAVAVQQLFTYSSNNSTNGTSTAFNVATGASWTGAIEAAINQNYATISVISTRAVTVTVNQYLDAAGSTADVPPVSFVVAANVPYTFPVAIQGNYVRLSVSNASGATAGVTVDTYYGPLPVEPNTLTQAGNKRASIQEQQVTISTVNSSAVQISSGAIFVGVWEAVLNTASVQVSVVCDQFTTITIQQAQDAFGTRIVSSKIYTRGAGVPFAESLLVVGTYLRVMVQNNGALTTTALSVQTIFTPVMNQSPVGPDNYGNMPVAISQSLYGPGGTNAVFVGGTSQVQVTPTVTAASAYASGNVVGGLLTFNNAVQSNVLSGVLESVTLAVKSTQTASFKLYLFNGLPSTTFADKTAPAISAADAAKLLEVITLTGGDTGLGPNATLYVADNIGKSLVLSISTLYAVLVVVGSATFTTASDVVVTASILKD